MEFRPSDDAFDNAIRKGMLLDQEHKSSFYAGKFMYMYSKGKIDYFKHVDTRKYIEVPYSN